MDVFKLLVSVIVFLALLYALLNFVPYFFPEKDPYQLLSNSLEAAQISQGKPFFFEIRFAKDFSMQAKNFDSSIRSATFECNDPAICCNLGDKCDLIEWDERQILFNSAKTMGTYARCAFEATLFSCKIYFGKEPAQIAIRKTFSKQEINLDNEDVNIGVEIENIGKGTMLSGQLEIKAYSRYLEEGIWKKRYSEASSKKVPLQKLLAGEKASEFVLLELNAGSYEFEIIASGENSGFDKNTAIAKVSGERSCAAQNCENPGIDFSTGKCKTVCNCTGCMLGAYCEEKIKAKNPAELGLPAGIALNSLDAIITGSNRIEFVLGRENC